MNSIKVMDAHSSGSEVCRVRTAEIRNNQDRIIRAQFEKYLRPYLLIILFLTGLLALEIYRWVTQSPPLPGLFTGLFLVGLTYALYQIHEYRDQLRFIHLGRKGEPDTSEVLKKYQSKNDTSVISDVKFGSDSVDYIVTNRSGVFLINIINWYAPINKEAVIQYNDEELLLNGYRPGANPVVKQKFIAHWLTDKLNKDSDYKVEVKAIVIFPDWFVETPQESAFVKVMNPRELESYLDNNGSVLSQEEKTLIDYRLQELIKNKN